MSDYPRRNVSDDEIEALAIMMIGQHGDDAARAAAERVNEMIDRDDLYGRDVWARVVHAVHERQHDPAETHIRGRAHELLPWARL